MSKVSLFGSASRFDRQFWWRSFLNLLQLSLRQWLPSRLKFWLAILVWTTLTQMVCAFWFTTNTDPIPPVSQLFGGWLFVSTMRGVFTIQGIISEEKLTGTMAWILSKPVPRSAFYLAKLIAQMVVALVVSVLVTSVFAYANLGYTLNPTGFLQASLYLTLATWFYQSLTTMLDVALSNKAAKIGIPVALILMGNFYTLFDDRSHALVKFLGYILPWGLDALIVHNDLPQLATTGQPLTTLAPVIATVLGIPLFCSLGIWQLNCQEM